MDPQTLEKFRQRTRWVYYREGVAYGPCTADEIMEFIRNRELVPGSEVMELSSNRRVPVERVSFFADVLAQVEETERRKKEEHAFQLSTSHFGAHRRAFWAAVIGVPLVLALTLAVVLYIQNLRERKASEGPLADGQGFTVVEARNGEGTEAAGPAEAPAVVVQEQEHEEELEGYAIGLLVEKDQAQVKRVDGTAIVTAAPQVEALPKLPEAKAPVRRNPTKPGANGAEGMAKSIDEAGGVQEMDFSDEEAGAEEDAALRVERQLSDALDRCAGEIGGDQTPTLRAVVKLQPSGQVGGLQLVVDPPERVGDLRMCVSAEIARIRVVPFEGVPISIRASN